MTDYLLIFKYRRMISKITGDNETAITTTDTNNKWFSSPGIFFPKKYPPKTNIITQHCTVTLVTPTGAVHEPLAVN